MQAPLRALVLLALALGCAYASEEAAAPIPGVVELTADNWRSVLSGKQHVLVEFYTPYCGGCKALEPELRQVAADVEADEDLKGRFVIAKADADAEKMLAEWFQIKKFPALRMYCRARVPTHSNARDYVGPNTAAGLLRFIRRKRWHDKTFGRLDELDEIAAKAGQASGDKAKLRPIFKELKAAVKDVDQYDEPTAEVYVKVLKKALDKPAGWFASERARLERLVATGSVEVHKAKDMIRRVSVLGAFLGEEVEEFELDEEAGEDPDDFEDDEEEGWKSIIQAVDMKTGQRTLLDRDGKPVELVPKEGAAS